MEVIKEAVRYRIKEFADEAHGRKPNYKVVAYDKVMVDVVSSNITDLTIKVGIFNAAWAGSLM